MDYGFANYEYLFLRCDCHFTDFDVIINILKSLTNFPRKRRSFHSIST